MPVMIMGDGMLGQMMEPVEFPEEDENAVYANKDWATTGTNMKREHNIINSLYINAKELEDTVIERYKKYDIITENEAKYEEVDTKDADIILVAYGTTSRIAKTAMAKAREKGLKVGLIRPITLWPFPTKAFDAVCDGKKKFLTVEMSMGQMVEDVKLAVNGRGEVEFFGRTGGVIPTPNEILNKIEEMNGGNK